MFYQLKEVFEYLDRAESAVRVVILTGKGKHFTAGIDLFAVPADLQTLNQKADDSDPGRAAVAFYPVVKQLQDCISSMERVKVPVIAAINGLCLGAGNDFISTCDVRICTKDSRFSIKEVDLGLASDIGVHQRFQKIVGNGSLVRELSFTGREFGAKEAFKLGYVSQVEEDNEQCMKAALKLATEISSKSPVAVSASKLSIVHSRDHTVQEGLNHIALLNSVMLQTDDMAKAAMAAMSKEKAVYPKL